MTKFDRFILRKPYHINPVTIAFIDGSIISAAINLLTGMGSYDDYKKWITLAASLILIIDSILLLVWQNAASKLQESYKPWVEFINTQNKNSNSADEQQSTDWLSYIEKCNREYLEHKKNNENNKDNNFDIKSDTTESKKPNLPKYFIGKLILYPVLSSIFLLIGIGLMVWSFI